MFLLEHKIEEDSTEAKGLTIAVPLPKLTYNKMCPCTINEKEKGKKEEKKDPAKAPHIKWFCRHCGHDEVCLRQRLKAAAANERARKWIRKGNPLAPRKWALPTHPDKQRLALHRLLSPFPRINPRRPRFDHVQSVKATRCSDSLWHVRLGGPAGGQPPSRGPSRQRPDGLPRWS